MTTDASILANTNQPPTTTQRPMSMEERINDITFSEEDFADLDIPEEDQGTFDPAGDDAIAVTQSLITDTPETRRAGKKEALRIMLTDAMRRARKQAGLTQAQLADRLGDGVSQSWVSKLESANYDHQIESVLDYLSALEAELGITIFTKDGPIRVKYEQLAGEGDMHYVLRNAPRIQHLPDTYTTSYSQRVAA